MNELLPGGGGGLFMLIDTHQPVPVVRALAWVLVLALPQTYGIVGKCGLEPQFPSWKTDDPSFPAEGL